MDENEKTIDQKTYDLVADDIAGFDFGRVVELMSVAEKVATVAPKNTAILGLCQAELEMFNAKAKEIGVKRAEARKELEAELAQQKAAEAQERAEKEAAEAEEAEEAAKANRAKAIPAAKFNPAPTQTQQPAPSKTDEVARDNARRI